MKFSTYLAESDDYRGHHESPDRYSGSPLYNVIGVYPEDIYSDKALRYYGENRPYDGIVLSIIRSARNKPNMKVKIYRAIPKILTQKDEITDLEKQKAYILKYGKLPGHVSTTMKRYEYYDHISDKLKQLTDQRSNTEEQKISINPGDWVTLTRQYAIDHGRDNLNNSYRIISKTVPAKYLYTAGDSIHEWGYYPD